MTNEEQSVAALATPVGFAEIVLGLDPEGGASWALSIIGLTLVIRAAQDITARIP